MKIVIIGGVAGGASAAARARRLSDQAQIVVLERGDHPSFANCGMPYYVGGEIQSRDKLLVAPIEMLRQRHRLDIRTRSVAIELQRGEKRVRVRDLESGNEYTESYDKLILATGASPVRPPIEGIDGPRVLKLRDLADADAMREHAIGGATRAVVVGAGFIGIEVAENLVRRGIETTIIELDNQLLSPWDREMIAPLESHVRDQGVQVHLSEAAQRFIDSPDGIEIGLQSGASLHADFAVVCVGVRPESGLASQAGLACGPRGGIVVNDHMQTDDPDIYAVGDVTQVSDFVTKMPAQIPLAGPANRQGRIAADHIFDRPSTYRGTQGTAVVGVFGKVAAMTGQSEKALLRDGSRYEKIYIHPTDHAGYYPGAEGMTLKLLFDPDDGAILGAQCVGGKGVEKRIDIIAMAIQADMTVYDLEESELCYAPQFGHAKDPINMAGFVAAGVLRGDQPILHVDSLVDWLHDDSRESPFLLDVRSESEFAAGHVPDATNIPIEQLRERLGQLPRDRPIAAYCKVGQRGYLATRVLLQHGFDVVNLSGGYTLWCRYQHGNA
ncbi:FAD-dependent oxidoreductase [Rhodopirellula sp. JC639]|uniref:FAD-dependent oxidoreductase n=1 Tax=Stieleria mannarensis TaxID=2755585 RepID=UPI0015FF1092|nr:FAD-dependent oxidoreductase [Rhodopirellula sp. JC639]